MAFAQLDTGNSHAGKHRLGCWHFDSNVLVTRLRIILMPINDPIRRRKVAPAALAFDQRTARKVGQSVSYQQTVNTSVVQQDLQGVATLRDLQRVAKQLHHADMRAEMRSKQAISAYMESYEWDFAHDVTVTTETPDPLGFDNEVIRCQGAYMVGDVSDANAKFEFHCVKGHTGVWLKYCHIQMVFTVGMQITSARLSVYKNDVQWRVLDAMDLDMSNEAFAWIGDCVLGGECQVPVERGDKVDFRIYLESDAGGGDQLLGFPTSVYGYCGGVRLRGDTEQINSTNTGDGFAFT